MKPLISPSLYSDEEQFKKEQLFLWQNHWNFAGFATDLVHHNDYITRKVGSLSIIIQNCHGDLRVFTNICSHRFSQILSQPQGNGPLQCPYHGWLYNSEGLPVRITSISGFNGINEKTKESFKLEKWLVDKCGDLVFVKRRDNGVSLKEFLGDNYDILKELSAAMNEQIHYSEIILFANWKIWVESTLESYHAPYVHAQIVAAAGQLESIERVYGGDRYHSHYIRKSVKKKEEKLAALAKENQTNFHGYYHYLIFPSLLITTRYGIFFSLIDLQPISPGETKVIRYMFARNLETNSSEYDLESMKKIISQMAVNVWQEDKDICEQVHLGMLSVDRQITGILHQEEQRIYQFHQAYLNAMNYS